VPTRVMGQVGRPTKNSGRGGGGWGWGQQARQAMKTRRVTRHMRESHRVPGGAAGLSWLQVRAGAVRVLCVLQVLCVPQMGASDLMCLTGLSNASASASASASEQALAPARSRARLHHARHGTAALEHCLPVCTCSTVHEHAWLVVDAYLGR
jgi:hypothetical protein